MSCVRPCTISKLDIARGWHTRDDKRDNIT